MPDPAPPPTQVLLMAKQPEVRLIPLEKVEDAEVEVTLSKFVCKPPEKVEVPEWWTLRSPVIEVFPATVKGAVGEVVPIPKRPFESMVMAVLVAVAVEVDMRNRAAAESVEVAVIDKRAAGVEVPMPRR